MFNWGAFYPYVFSGRFTQESFLKRMGQAFACAKAADRAEAFAKFFWDGKTSNPIADLDVSYPEEWLTPIRKLAEGRGDPLADMMERGRVALLTGEYEAAGRLFLALYDRTPQNDGE